VEQGPQAVLAAVVRGQAPDTLLTKLQDTLEQVHLEFSDQLAAFEGDPAPFEPARPMLEECLATVLSTGRERRRRTKAAWLPWAIGATILLVALLWLKIRAEQRWDQAVASLRSEPGIVLTSAEREGGRWRFAGLRDPLAREPAALLAGAGTDTTSIEQRWEPYLSLRPQLVLARARRTLAPPATIAMALEGDTLRLRGSAPFQWTVATARSGLPPGVAALDLSGVEAEVPPALAAQVSDIEGLRVLFGVGSALLNREARTTTDRVAGAFGRLNREAAETGARASLELVGRTDPTGSDSTNRALSRDRAEMVRALLVQRGASSGAVRVSEAGTVRPLEAADSAERARINRSVSFVVSLGWEALGRESSP
jgi:outer membrane protein OmpA-like peptidoglycan-associated protein